MALIAYCQCRVPDADGSLVPSGQYWPSATQSAGNINGAGQTGGLATGGTATNGGAVQPTGGDTGTGGALQPTGGANPSGTSLPPDGGFTYTGSADYSPTSYPPPTSVGDLPPAGPTDDYHCPGVAAQKDNLYNENGGNSQDFAIASQENFSGNCGSQNVTSNYPYGNNQQGDAANCGAYKNNLGAVKSSCSIASQYPNDDDLCKELNKNLAAATQCQHEQIANLGQQGFYQYQRCGHLCTPGNEGCGDTYSYSSSLNCEDEGNKYGAAIAHNQQVVDDNPDNDYTGGYELYPV